MYSKTALTCSGWPSSTVSSVTCGWPTGLDAQLAHSLVEALGQQAVDDFLANLGRIAAADDRLRHLAGTEAGNLGVLLIVATVLGRPLRPLRREHRAPARGCIRDSEPGRADGHDHGHDRGLLIVCPPFGRLWLGGVFEGVE